MVRQEHNLQISEEKAVWGSIPGILITLGFFTLIWISIFGRGFAQVISIAGILLMIIILLNKNFKELTLTWASGIKIKR